MYIPIYPEAHCKLSKNVGICKGKLWQGLQLGNFGFWKFRLGFESVAIMTSALKIQVPVLHFCSARSIASYSN